MTQRLDSENELVTSTTDGLLLFWDCDEVDPVQAIDVGSHQKLGCARISPSGRREHGWLLLFWFGFLFGMVK
jgi:hypothetical protein